AAHHVHHGVEGGEFTAAGHAGDVHGRGDGEALLRDVRLRRVGGGLGEGGGGAAGDLLGADAAALAVHHQRGHARGDAAGGGGGDGFDVDGLRLLGGGLRGGGAVHAGLELGELVGDAGLFQFGGALGADLADGQLGADAVEVVGEAHGVLERLGVDVVEAVDAFELGDRAGLQLGEVVVGREGEIGRGAEQLVGHGVLRIEGCCAPVRLAP